MFENLQERLQRTFKSLRGQAVLNEENIQETMRELRLALLEADVNFKVVKQFIDQVQAKAVGQQGMSALSRGEELTFVAQAIKAQIYHGEVAEANTATVERLAKEARREAVTSGCDVLIV